MHIKGVGNNLNKLHDQYKKHGSTKEAKNSSVKDKIEISEEAKLLSAQNVDGHEIEKVRSRIDNGFYNTDEVLNKVAEAILKELNRL